MTSVAKIFHPRQPGAPSNRDRSASALVAAIFFNLEEWMGNPSGYVNIAIENGHRNSGFSH